MKTTYKTTGFHVVLAFLALQLTQCAPSTADDQQKESGPAVLEAEVFSLKKEKLASTIQIPGELIAYQSVDIYAKVTGFVKTLNADIGSVVKQGEVLVTLDAPETLSQLRAAESRLKSQEATYTASEANYNRLLQTSKTPGTISTNDLDLALARKNADFANLEAARAAKRELAEVSNYLSIRAPFSGVITARNVNVGAYVGPSGRGSENPIFTLQHQDKLRLVLSVPESYTAYLRAGDEVTFKVKARPSEEFKAKAVRLAGALDTRLRAERVEFDIDNRNGKLLAGSVADVSIPLSTPEETFAVPRSAIINSAEGIYIIKIHNGKTKRLSIKKGLETKDRIEIFADVQEGDTVMLKASDEIKDETLVKI